MSLKLSKIFENLNQSDSNIVSYLIEQLKIPKEKPQSLQKYSLKELKDRWNNEIRDKILRAEHLTDEEKDIVKYLYNVLSSNTKTEIALDFMPGTPQETGGTCGVTCSFCYVIRSLKTQPSKKIRYQILGNLVKYYPDLYLDIASYELEEYFSKINSELDAVRWFGSGDYQPYMKKIMIELAQRFPDKRFYIISKTLVSHYSNDIEDLVKIPNIFINLSFWRPTKDLIIKFYPLKKKYPNLRIAYTLDEFEGIRIFKKGKEISREEFVGEIHQKRTQHAINSLKQRAEILKNLDPNIYEKYKAKLETAILLLNLKTINNSQARKNYEELYKQLLDEIKKIQPEIARKEAKKGGELSKKEKPIGFKPEEEWDFLKTKETDLIVELTPEYIDLLKMADVIFNVNRGKAYKLAYYKSQLAFCECDMGMAYENLACVRTCHKCYQTNLEYQQREIDTETGEEKILTPAIQTLGEGIKNGKIRIVLKEVNALTLIENEIVRTLVEKLKSCPNCDN